ncbi:SDR family oxidoreductase [Sphingobium sp. CFD-2]|uniref:SDR family oxidoreductase n=1 Tax=Sphingobium sp. CFD-2 TaxID=2878542 RepID=UPI00214AEADC|nr:SDR family oxidoreductase [Sphingobium sp. CFD-2]
MTDLTGAVVALTGSGSGLGLGLAQYFGDCGATLALLDISSEKVAALQESFGDDILAMQGDVRDIGALTAFRDAIITRFGRVDCLVGAQGIFDGNRPISDLPVDKVPAAFDEVMQINVLGYILSAIVFREELAKRNGSITLTASSNASYCADGGGLLYTASKHAVVGVVRQLAFEFAPDIRVNAVSPCGIADSDLRGPGALGLESESQNDIPKDSFMAMIRKVTLLDHLPTGAEYGPAYAILADPKQRILTGEIIMADQGLANRPIISSR